MRAEEGFDRSWLGTIGIGRGNCVEEFKEFLTSVGGKGIGGVADDVGVLVLTEVKADCEPAWAGVGVVVRNDRNASGIGKADSDWRGLLDMRGAGECGRSGYRGECSGKHNTLG